MSLRKYTLRPAKQMDSYTVRPRTPACAVTDTRARLVVPIPKERPVRDEAYRRRVAALPCAHCGRIGQSQAAHGDEGKGMGIKSSDETCFPLCADSPGRRGCHSLLGSSGLFSQAVRRKLEAYYSEQTRRALGAAA